MPPPRPVPTECPAGLTVQALVAVQGACRWRPKGRTVK